MREEKPEKPLWPKTPLQWLGVLAMVFFALSLWDVVMQNFRDPFPQLRQDINQADRELEQFRQSIKEMNESSAGGGNGQTEP